MTVVEVHDLVEIDAGEGGEDEGLEGRSIFAEQLERLKEDRQMPA